MRSNKQPKKGVCDPMFKYHIVMYSGRYRVVASIDVDADTDRQAQWKAVRYIRENRVQGVTRFTLRVHA